MITIEVTTMNASGICKLRYQVYPHELEALKKVYFLGCEIVKK